jgi:hypothetical protein
MHRARANHDPSGAAAHDPSRIQGGNWSMQGFRRSGHVHDEAECLMSIAEFMGDRERGDDVE